MKLLRQISLQFVEGSSRKAYEVDLCEVSEGRFVVNFRYGRIGTALRDGTKTAAPVSLDEAERVFAKLVAEKKAKGYREVSSSAAPPPSSPTSTSAPAVSPAANSTGGQAARRRAVLDQLRVAVVSGSGRPLSRLAWRVGELRIEEAGPDLLALLEGTREKPAGQTAKPGLRLVKRDDDDDEALPNLATVETFSAVDSVGTLRTKAGDVLRFGGTACRGFFPSVGLRVVYDDVEPHPLGGMRARTVRLTPAAERRALDEKRRRESPFSARKRRSADDLASDEQRARLRYSLVWTLGRVRYEPAVEALATLFFTPPDEEGQERTPEQRMAGESLFALATGEQRARLRARVLEELPASLAAAIERDDGAEVKLALDEHLAAGTREAFAALDLLYLLVGESPSALRDALLAWVRETPLKPPAFQRFRHLFKAAEHRGDWQLFGLCAWRLEKTPAMVTGYGYAYVDGRWVNIGEEAQKPDAKLAYSGATRRYLRHRVWRTLRRLGESGDREYAKAAAGVLLPFSDADAQAVRTSTMATYAADDPWRPTGSVDVVFDRFAPYWTFNHVLYRHSPRYFLKPNGRAFRCRDGYRPGGPVPDVREEAFPSLWDAAPVALLHLCLESDCTPVLEHAVRGMRHNPKFTDTLPVEALASLLARPIDLVARLGLALAEPRYDERAPDLALVLALLASPLDEARQRALSWIERDLAGFAKDAAFLVRVALLPFADVRALARELFPLAGPALGRDLTTRVIASLLGLDDEAQNAAAYDAGEALRRAFPALLRDVGLDVVRDLLAHRLEEVQAFGARLLLGHAIPPAELPKDLLPSLMNARFPAVRAVGVQLFGALPEDALPERLGLFRDLCTSPLADVRAAVRPVLARLAPRHPAFVSDLATLLIPALLRKERSEGLHDDLVAMLLDDLRGGLSWAKAELVRKLLRSKQRAAQRVGGALLDENLRPDDLALPDLVELLSHELLSVRERTRHMLEASLPRLRADMSEAVRALDAAWPDSREWAFAFFEERFSEEDFTPAILVGICDSVREDVQRFGMKLLHRYFEEPFGEEYLLKLSEHPSASLQLHATSYLERFATGDVERLRELAPFFLAVLSRVNKGRVAKARVLAFLDEAARQDEASARVVADVLTRQSVTIAIGDKARAIETLARIHARWPSVPVPLVVKPAEVRDGV